MTALMLASKRGHIETVRLLLQYKAQVNIKDINGQTALMFAITYEDIKNINNRK